MSSAALAVQGGHAKLCSVALAETNFVPDYPWHYLQQRNSMRSVFWIAVGVAIAPVLWFLVKAGLGIFMPEKAAVTAYLMEELKRVDVDPAPLPDDFYTECYDFAKTVAIAAPSQTRLGRRNHMAGTMSMLAKLTDLWIRDPSDPVLRNPFLGGGYSKLFEKYQFKRLSKR
jgi:hypothetical protein